MRAQILGKVVFDEYPGPARFGARQQAALGAAAHDFLVHLEKGGGLVEVQRVHGR